MPDPVSNTRNAVVTATAVMPWKTKKKWDAAAIADYQSFAQSWLRSKVEAGLVRDCADTAISLVIDYGESKGLPVAFNKAVFDPKVISNQVGYVYYPAEGYTRAKNKPFRVNRNKTQFDATIRTFWSAQMLATEGHTKKITHAEAKPGDLLLFDWSDSAHWHTMLIGERDDQDEPCWLVMGNLSGGQPTPLEMLQRSAGRVGHYWRHADLYQGGPRRWDFDFFNSTAK